MNRRIALCIGIANYYEHELKLKNAVNDARCIHLALKSRGFESTLLLDPTVDTIMQALSDLRTKILEAVGDRVFAVVFYAGHAIEVGGFGVVMPQDMPYPVTAQAILRSGVPVLEIVDSLSPANGPKVVLIDACRDGAPVATWDQFQMQRFNEWVDAEAKRLKEAADVDEVAIAYSTSAGQFAFDGVGLNSLYCERLRASLLSHEGSIVESLTEAGRQVTEKTRAKQRPWVYTNMTSKAGFSDLPSYALASSTTLIDRQVSGARLHVRRMDDSLAVNTNAKLQLLRAGAVSGTISHPDSYTVASFWEDEVVLAGHRTFSSIHAGAQDKQGNLQKIAELDTDCDNPHGIAIGPDGTFAIVYGNSGYCILSRRGGQWENYFSEKTAAHYGAIFHGTDVAFLCGSSGYVTRLQLSGEEPDVRRIDIGRYRHAYDLAWISDQQAIAAVCDDGVVVWIDTGDFSIEVRQMFEWPSIDVPGAYGRLRRVDMSPDEASLFLEDPERFESEVAKKAWSRLGRKDRPDYHLICCSVAADPRVLAVGADAGLVFLIDVRSREHWSTLNAGSDIGAPLQWIACTADGAIQVLAADGIIRCFEPVPPPV